MGQAVEGQGSFSELFRGTLKSLFAGEWEHGGKWDQEELCV